MRSNRTLVHALFLVLGFSHLFVGRSALAQISDIELVGAGPILERVDAVLADVVSLRGLTPRESVPVELLTREELGILLETKLQEDLLQEDIRVEERVLRRLGALSGEASYRDVLVGLYMSEITGLYDEDSDRLYLLDDLPAQSEEPTLAHELFHGIQDQIFGLTMVRPENEHMGDASLAATALIEGDAVGVMIDYQLGGALSFTDIPNFAEYMTTTVVESGISGEVSTVPRFLAERILFPYIEGLLFVHYLKLAAGWEIVNQAYLDPPLSTEQILHPERYLERDQPTRLELDVSSMVEAGFVVTYDQVLGELQWRSLFRHNINEVVSERAIGNAAAGWDGDRFFALEDASDRMILISMSVWDSYQDAVEFAGVLRRMIEELWQVEMELSEQGETGELWVVDYDDCLSIIERWGDMVLFLDRIPLEYGEDDMVLWREALWSGRSREPYR